MVTFTEKYGVGIVHKLSDKDIFSPQLIGEGYK